MDFKTAFRRATTWFGLGGLILLALAYVAKWLPEGASRLGAIGDAFAPITGVFACVAVLLTVEALKQSQAALTLAQQTLKTQQDELAETRIEIKGQREAQQEQARQLKESNALSLLASAIATARLEHDLYRFLGMRYAGDVAATRWYELRGEDLSKNRRSTTDLERLDQQRMYDQIQQVRALIDERKGPLQTNDGNAAPTGQGPAP